MSAVNVIDATEKLASAGDHLHCRTCKQTVPLFEVFDAWEIPGADREACPRCFGPLLSPLDAA